MKRKKAYRRKSGGGFFSKRKSHRGKGGSGVNILQVDAMIYGGLREKVSDILAPYTNKIPLGTLADEAGMALIDWLLAKNMSGMIKDVAMKGLIVENARVGEAIAQGTAWSGGTSTTTTTTTYQYG